MRLENWIDPRHLEPAVQAAYAARFSSAPYASVVIDDFLRVDKFTALQRVFSAEGRFEERYYLNRRRDNQTVVKDEAVSVELWNAAPEPDRASCERGYVGPLPTHRMGQGIVALAKFLELADSPEFMGFLEAVTGIRPARLSAYMIRIMSGGHYVRPHNDSGPNRNFCAIYYASPGWDPSFGGRFRHRGPGPAIVPIEPKANRVILLEPRIDCLHDVEPITDAGAHWQRWAHTLWFGATTVDSEFSTDQPLRARNATRPVD